MAARVYVPLRRVASVGSVLVVTGRFAMLAGLFALAATPAQAAPRLRAFDSCAALVRYADAHAPPARRIGVIPPPSTSGTPDGAPSAETQPSAAPDVSQTNVQEAGIDEPDIVKTDGRTLFAIGLGRLQAIDAAAAPARLLGSVALPAGGDHQLLLHDGRAAGHLPRPDRPFPLPRPVRARPGAPVTDSCRPTSRRRPSSPRSTSATLPRCGSCARSPSTGSGRRPPARRDGARRRLLVAARLRRPRRPRQARRLDAARDAAPRHRRRAAAPAGCSPCRAVRRPRAFAGAGMLSVLTIDLERGLPAVDADALMTDGETVYASAGPPLRRHPALRRRRPADAPSARRRHPPLRHLRPAQHDLRGERQRAGRPAQPVLAVGGRRRPARGPSTGVVAASAAAELRRPSCASATAGSPQLGQVGGLGRGERIYAVRFIGDVGYVVTFRQTDPLFTIDLSDPAAPRSLGELELLGYSAYLHPVGDGRLLGVGQDATRERAAEGRAGLAVRRVRPGAPAAARAARARRRLRAGRVRPPRVPLVAGDPAGCAAADRRGPRRARAARGGWRDRRGRAHRARRDAGGPRHGRRRPALRACGDGVVVASLDSLAERGFVAFGAAR